MTVTPLATNSQKGGFYHGIQFHSQIPDQRQARLGLGTDSEGEPIFMHDMFDFG